MACLLCDGTTVTLRYQLSDYRISRCNGCGFEFNSDFRDGDGADGTFGAEYFTERHRVAFEAPFRDYREDASVPIFLQRLAQIEARVAKGTLVDVGCGPGTFLRLAHERGWRAQGVEISRFAAERAQAAHGLPIFCGELKGLDRPAGSVDVITFWDSLEHVSDPLTTLRSAHRLLRRGGLVLIATDNFDCLIADLAVGLYRASFGRVEYPMRRVFIDRNRSFFTLQTLQSCLERGGFRTVMNERMEYPLDKIETTRTERVLLRALYTVGGLLQRQAQVTVLAERV